MYPSNALVHVHNPGTMTNRPTPKKQNVACASSVKASVGLQDLANRANRTDVSITNQNMNNAAGNYNGTFVQEILWQKIFAQDYHSDDDVSTISDADSDILVTVEKADIIEFLDYNSSTFAGFQEELSTSVIFKSPQKLIFGDKVQKGTSGFTRPKKRVGPPDKIHYFQHS